MDKHFLKLTDQISDRVNFFAHVKTHVSSHLVVSGAACVQTLTGVANQLGKTSFDI